MNFETVTTGLVASVLLIAQAANIDTLGGVVSSLGVVGTLVWYLYHNTTKTIPGITERYTTTITSITDNFSETLKQEREYRKQEIQSLKEWIKQEAQCKYNQDHPRGNDDAT